MCGGSSLNILVPLFQDKLLAHECFISVKDFANKNSETVINLKISDDSNETIVYELLKEVKFGTNVKVTVLPKRPKLTKNHAVDNWNYLIASVTNKSYYLLLHHDERLPNERIDFNSSDTLIMSLNGKAKRRQGFFARLTVSLVTALFPKFLYVVNFIGPTACVISSTKLYYDNRLRWLVDVDYYFRLFKYSKKVKFLKNEVRTTFNKNSITSSLDQFELSKITKTFNLFNFYKI
jgi:hypothetical protein